MQHDVSLNDLYADFSAGLMGRKELEGAVFRVVSENVRGLPGFSQHDYEDYFSWLYPRLSRAIAAYQETGSSFESFINTMVHLTAREYRQREARNYAAEETAWITQYPNSYTFDGEPEYNEDSAAEPEEEKEDATTSEEEAFATASATASAPEEPASAPEEPLRRKKPRQLLILVLKCCNYVSVDFLERVSPMLEIEPDALGEMIDRLRVLREKRERDICLQRERANLQFFRCVLYERTLQTLPKDCITAQKYRDLLARGRKRLAKMRKHLARLHLDPSNRQIAEVLGISKGTVDSALHALKIQFPKEPLSKEPLPEEPSSDAQPPKARWNDDQNRHILN